MANIISRVFQRSFVDRLAGITLLVCLVALRIWDPVPVQVLRLKAFDFFQQAAPREANKFVVAIIDIDEESLNEYGQWPWARTQIADLVDNVTKAGAVAIGFDILFPEHDRLSPANIADAMRGLDENLKKRLLELPSTDEQLAAAFTRSRVVLGQSAYHREIDQWHAGKSQRTALATIGPKPGPFLYSYPGIIRNIPELENAAKGLGLVTIRPEVDGVVRRVPALMRVGEAVLPAISIELLRVATGSDTLLAKSDKAGVSSVVLPGLKIPTDGKSRIWINFSRHEPARFISARDVLAGKLKPGALKGKLVLVGTSAVGLFDLKATPLDPAMPGVEIHAQLLENILTGAMLTRPNWAIGAELSMAVFASLVMIAIVPLLGALFSLIAGGVMAAIFAGSAVYLYVEKAFVIDMTFPLFTSISTFALLVFLNYFHEETQRRQIRGAFGQYLSPELVNQLAADPGKLMLGGETKEMTILFSDVRDFTSISETYKENPQGLTVLINRLLTPLSQAVVDNSGTIDKYMGDNIMAFWNAPLDDERHAINACTAALEMMVSLEVVNAERAQEAAEVGETARILAIGIGVGTGECVVGNMGSDLRFDYTVLGDVVNVSSRLEGQSKAYGVIAVIGAKTATDAAEEFALLEIDLVQVKGKQQPEKIFTLVGDKQILEGEAFKAQRAAQEAFLAAYRAQDWSKALAAIETCRIHAGEFNLERLYGIFADRIAEFKTDPPPQDWQGVFVARGK
jgi:adenylate cyclase